MNRNIVEDIQELDISLIDEYPNHPFKVVDDEKMIELTEIATCALPPFEMAEYLVYL